MIGYLRQYKKEHTVTQVKPADVTLSDLRLAEPFEELQKFVDEFDMAALDSLQHGHTPYVVILIQTLKEWRDNHDGTLPKKIKDKKEFKAIVKSKARDFSKEMNFEEAINNAHLGFTYEKVPAKIQEILDDPKVDSSEFHSNFWTLAAALKRFVDEHGCLPVTGQVPDMTATSDFFISMQEIYHAKAKEDRDKMSEYLSKVADEKGLMDVIIEDQELKQFCENCRILEVTRMRSFKQELEEPSAENMSDEFWDENGSIAWYIAIRTTEMFRTKNGRYPGESVDTIEADIEEMKEYVPDLLKTLGCDESISYNYDYISEMARYSNSCIHNV